MRVSHMRCNAGGGESAPRTAPARPRAQAEQHARALPLPGSSDLIHKEQRPLKSHHIRYMI